MRILQLKLLLAGGGLLLTGVGYYAGFTVSNRQAWETATKQGLQQVKPLPCVVLAVPALKPTAAEKARAPYMAPNSARTDRFLVP